MEDDDLQQLQSQTQGQPTHPFSWEPCGAMIIGQWEGGNSMLCNSQFEEYGIGMKVALDRPLLWDTEKVEWRWHKTWRLPEILVKAGPLHLLNIIGSGSGPGGQGAAQNGGLPPGTNLEIRLNVVCAGNHTNELVDVGLATSDGVPFTACLPVVDGECRFARLRLLGTSNTHGGKRFHIVISTLMRHGNDTKVVASLISSGFSVYSRKDADKKRKKNFTYETTGDGTPTEAFFEPFSPELFTKEFIKKVNDHQGNTTQEPIENSWIGLMRYFQAPNIRFKSRHPLLLAARFSNVIRIMRDGSRYPIEDENTVRELFCACGFPQICNIQDCHSCYTKQSAASFSETDFLASWMLVFSDQQQIPEEAYRWLSEHMSCVKSPCLGFIADAAVLPSQYIPLTNINYMVDMYCRVYSLEYAPRQGSQGGPAASPRAGGGGGGGGGGALSRGTSSANPHRAPSTVVGGGGPGGSAAMASHGFRDVKGDDSDHEDDHRHGGAGGGNKMNVDTWSALGQTPTKAQFAEYYIGLHTELRAILSAFSDAASNVVAMCSEESINELKNIYYEFTEAVAAHAFVEDTILFPELTKRVPGVAESYNYDHFKQSDHLTKIYATISSLDENNAAELFLQVSGFAAIHEEHMEKEEEHLLPYFMNVFSDQELMALMEIASKSSMNQVAGGAGGMMLDQQVHAQQAASGYVRA
mmetsp:Transcript_1864/g.3259  ORF Transcript_1864/g.3259 Transcript_1864/m.3259 type:complete len:696 (+) Transcript_1864:288-2375(+)|eukprot:CAMPEP_0184692364 /NCGR_PEP_ID=MMETSP0313-20130426/880_1 /TAXON_ID=2792 /ORGANISM="Porphyridium aerugineum, Strain SAG 1380-2" /LENGTH=695 /DNA_ID=CAMNT_0027150191 /DNA_START=206 /DNA_END=2296 /DNA_ORIENTATION=+